MMAMNKVCKNLENNHSRHKPAEFWRVCATENSDFCLRENNILWKQPVKNICIVKL